MTNDQTNSNNRHDRLREEWLLLTAQLLRRSVNRLQLEDWQRGGSDHLHALTSELLGLAAEALARHGVEGTLDWRGHGLKPDGTWGWGQWEDPHLNLHFSADSNDVRTAEANDLRVGDCLL